MQAYQPELEVLVAFVDGNIGAEVLEQALHTERMQALLSVFINPRYPASTNYCRKLIKGADRDSLSGLVNSERIVAHFLTLAEVSHMTNKPYGQLYQFILAIQLEYLDIPADYFLAHILPNEDGLSKTQKIKIAKQKIKTLFRYSERAPQWIQDPQWPIYNQVPSGVFGANQD
ncbi:hypothetical protein [Paralysiella testudinis]|uniref:Uncharacterized protein n=1 Tax=Paralysiella testudinis TaxID=2809020 RepID=A0A892ZKK4_9NEIS|nr:hypothetical protein [Paralysiella testudinis]QRQ82990.1 hypothetical protein JQU52_06350 [Paralysiella testudinis]